MRTPDRIVSAVEDRRGAIVDVIRSARRSLALSLFRCTDDEIFDELAKAVKRGVRVEALVTSRAKGGKKKLKKLWTRLEQAGAIVHAYADPVVKYHAKYIVADEERAAVASFNFTRKCFERTCDVLVVTSDSAVVAGLCELMKADREERPIAGAITPRLVIGPDTARRQFTSLIAQARSSIRLIDAKLSDPDILALLKQRRVEGLRVQVFGGKRLGSLKSHGKVLLIDDRVAVVGSLALAALSLDFRREVAIVVEEPSAVAEIAELFRGIETLPSAESSWADARGAAV
jgi:phosphatidylserine/phosphatidylglycerophosphate/cardiolipin synthase-like enzyme